MSGTQPVSVENKKRRRSNAGKACLNCRRRKAKCIGPPPICQTCQLYNDECNWGEDDDGRKPASRQYVQSLKNRIASLESALEAKGHSLPSLGDVLEEDCEVDDESDRVLQTMLHLQIGTNGDEVHFHGPTSAYAHLAIAPTPRSPPLEWSEGPTNFRRFLPAIEISPAQHALALDRFFRFFASWGMRAVPNLFQRDLALAIQAPVNAPSSRTTHYSPMLHNSILAIALMFLDDDYFRALKTRQLLADEATRYMELELTRPTLATVQALALKSSYYSLLGDHTLGWTYFGLADRAAQSLGLNVDCSPLVKMGKMSETEMLLRNNTWWTMFIQDQCWSVYIGRSQSMHDYNTRIPLVNPALDAVQWTHSPSQYGEIPSPPQDSVLSSTFVETAKLAIIMQKVMTTLYSLKADASKKLRDGAISELSLALDTWHEQLPPTLVLTGHSDKNALPHVIMLHIAWDWLIILCYRSYYRYTIGLSRRAETEEISAVAVRRCDRSAARINSLLRIYHNRFNLRFSPPTLLNVAFTAGTTHLLAAVHHRSVKVKGEAVASANASVELLRLVAASWPAAKDKADILEGLVTKYLPAEIVDSQLDLFPQLKGVGKTPSPVTDPLFDFMQHEAPPTATGLAPWPQMPTQQVSHVAYPTTSAPVASKSLPVSTKPISLHESNSISIPPFQPSAPPQQVAQNLVSQSPAVNGSFLSTQASSFEQSSGGFFESSREDADSFLRALMAHVTLPLAQPPLLSTSPNSASTSFFSQIYPNNAAYGQTHSSFSDLSRPHVGANPASANTEESRGLGTTLNALESDQEWVNFFGSMADVDGPAETNQAPTADEDDQELINYFGAAG